MWVAVAPHTFAKGVNAPGENGRTYDWREPEHSRPNSAGVDAAYEVLPLDEALSRTYPTDAHLVTYVVLDPSGERLTRQPRINKSSVSWLYRHGYRVVTTMLLADIDTPGHVPWSQGLLQRALERLAENAWLRDKGHYFTRKGERALQDLTEPIDVFCAESGSRAWLLEGLGAGVPIDQACKDWTRHYRLPNVTRADGREDRYAPTLDAMASLDLGPLVRVPRFPDEALEEFGEAGRAWINRAVAKYGLEDAPTEDTSPESARNGPRAPRKPRVRGPIRWSAEVPALWEETCQAVASACAGTPIQTGHTLYMPLAGALLRRGVPHEHLPSVVARIAELSGHRGEDYGKLAATSAERDAAGRTTQGLPTLHLNYPHVARAVETSMPRGAAAYVATQQAEAAGKQPQNAELRAAQEKMYQEVRFSEHRVSYIESSCGSGKTFVATSVARDRFLETDRTPAGHLRGGARTTITGDKHRLAIQTTRILRSYDVPVARLFSPPSLRDDSGDPVCQFEEAALALAEGGLSVPKLLCRGSGKQPCPHLDGCEAAAGFEGDPKAPVVVATHAKLGAATSHIPAAPGSKGLVVIDEPPSLLTHEVLTAGDLAHAEAQLSAFADRYAAAMRPLLGLVTRWLEAAPADGPTRSLLEIVEECHGLVHAGHLYAARSATGYDEENMNSGLDAIALARRAFPPAMDASGVDDSAGPLQLSKAIMARKYPALARSIGRANKTLQALYACAKALPEHDPIAEKFPPKLRVEEVRDEKVLRVVCPNHEYVDVLRSGRRVVLLGAKSDLHVAELRAVTGAEDLAVYRHAVADGAPVARTIMPCTTANRSMWAPHGPPIWENGVLSALTRAVAWAQEDPGTTDLCLITFRSIEVALRAALEPQESRWQEAWGGDLGLPLSGLQKGVQALLPVVGAWGGTWVFGYYGGLRGMNDAEGVQALVTLGDPRPNLSTERVIAEYLGLEGEDYVHQKAQEELEQAHGRLRAPRRTTPARALHIGVVVPYGYGWDKAERRTYERDHTQPSAMTNEEFREIRRQMDVTQEELAVALGIGARSVERYEKGGKVRSGIAVALRRLAASE